MEEFTKQYVQELAHKYKMGTLTEAERVDYDRWYDSLQDKIVEWPDDHALHLEEIRDRMEVNIRNRTGLGKTIVLQKKMTLFWRVTVAASVLLILSAGGYFLLHTGHAIEQVTQVPQDIIPGSNKAILTLANGEQITLSGAEKGKLSVQGNTTISQVEDGKVVYNSGKLESSEIIYNTMTTPRAGQYHLILSDGTNVWLNASSSITYPTAFNGKNRQVSITGEVFFQVKHNAAQPFRVAVKEQIIEDLGTEFNINAYNDEPVIKTTLLQGSVRLLSGNQSATLKPGQDATIKMGSKQIKVGEADLDQALAWKNGNFIFDNEDLASIMRKVSRWYDVDVVFEPGANISENYIGSMTRYTNVSQVLKVLEETGHVRFKIEGRRIIVRKK